MADKIAVVTGGAGGIGQAVVTRLARAGFNILVLDKNDEAGRETSTFCGDKIMPQNFIASI